MVAELKSDRREVPASRDEEWARFWASLDDWPESNALIRARREAEEWEAAWDDAYAAALEREERAADVRAGAWISVPDAWAGWPRVRSLLLLSGDL
jgi:hypothetical protein